MESKNLQIMVSGRERDKDDVRVIEELPSVKQSEASLRKEHLI